MTLLPALSAVYGIHADELQDLTRSEISEYLWQLGDMWARR